MTSIPLSFLRSVVDNVGCLRQTPSGQRLDFTVRFDDSVGLDANGDDVLADLVTIAAWGLLAERIEAIGLRHGDIVSGECRIHASAWVLYGKPKALLHLTL